MYLEFALVQVACGEWRGSSGWISGVWTQDHVNTSQTAPLKVNEIKELPVDSPIQTAPHPWRFKQGEIE